MQRTRACLLAQPLHYVWCPLAFNSWAGLISGLNISGGVYIGASNVTLENCIITIPSSGNFVINVAAGLTGVVIKNCEIVGAGLTGQSGSYGIYLMGNSQVTLGRI